MAVDFFEIASTASGSSELRSQLQQQPNQCEWSTRDAARPHLKLYERNSNVECSTSIQSPLGESALGCWSPISSNEDDGAPKPVWSIGYDNWMQNSSSENSTISSTEDYDGDPFLINQPQAHGDYQQQYNIFQQYNQVPTNQTTNDENLISQILNLKLDTSADFNGVAPSIQNFNFETTARKWSQESDTDLKSQQPMNGNCSVYNNHYAPYIQQQPMQRISNLPVDDGLTPHFIPATNAKWSTASDQPILNSTKNAPTFEDCQQVDIRPQRQIFAQLNALATGPQRQRPGMSCDEAEIQWYHQHLELQQCLYDQIYKKVLSGELKKKQTSKQTNQQGESGYDRSNTPPISSVDLAFKLEQCTAQYRQLEKERKKTEAELAKHNLGKKISSSNQLQIPRLPTAPSRIDRLIVDFFREHARVITLLCRMEQLRGVKFEANLNKVMLEWLDAIRLLQQRRLSERNAILSHLSGELGFYDEEAELSNQKEALVALTKASIRARAANWCALVQTLGVNGPLQQMQLERIQALEYQCEPPEIPSRPLNNQNT